MKQYPLNLMMTEETFVRIEEYAAHFMRVDEIAILTGIDEEDLKDAIADKKSELSKRYRKARAESVFSLRQKILKLAKNGSPQAELLIAGFIQEQTLSEND
jgi:hypothetical protein